MKLYIFTLWPPLGPLMYTNFLFFVGMFYLPICTIHYYSYICIIPKHPNSSASLFILFIQLFRTNEINLLSVTIKTIIVS